MNRQSIKLLVTLVLLVVAATSVWITSQADARGLTSPGASSLSNATRPDADIAAGDPDAGSGGGITPQPPNAQKKLRELRGDGGLGRGLTNWVQWAGRIWATLYLRAGR